MFGHLHIINDETEIAGLVENQNSSLSSRRGGGGEGAQIIWSPSKQAIIVDTNESIEYERAVIQRLVREAEIMDEMIALQNIIDRADDF